MKDDRVLIAERAMQLHRRPIPGPRLTAWGALMIVAWLGLPLLAVLALADLILYLLFELVLGRCYGLGCWLG